jgi:hypothetical protein
MSTGTFNLPKHVLKSLRLCQKYKDKAALLRQTGGGIGAPDDAESDGVHHYLDYYIPHDGPHHDTPVAAKNIWGASQICINSAVLLISS